MSANSDARQILDLAREQGYEIVKTKHGGYAIMDGDRLVTRVPQGGNGRLHWVRGARRALARRAT